MNSIRINTIVAAVICIAAAVACSQEIVGPGQGVVLLRNGYVLHGRISREGDYYVIAASEKSEVRLPQQQVQVIADNLEQICHYRRSRLPAHDANALLDLARWALRNDLPQQAADLMVAAAKIQPDHPGIEEIERRLKAASAPLTPTSASKANVETREQLAQATSEIPPMAVAAFTHKVQPLLLNHCGNSGCHGLHAKSEFRLLRSPWRTTVTQQITQRNLHATLKQIDHSTPEKSPLLTAAGSPHGKLDKAVFDVHQQKHLKLINDWIDLIVTEQPQPQPATVASRLTQPLLQTPTDTSATPFARPAALTQPLQPQQKRLPSTSSVSDDPFDPEVFNQQFVD